YNEEAGIVQHIINVPVLFFHGQKEITPNFTQEWPVFTQTHQFSYTLPYTFAENQNGLEDIRLNYRLQALMESESTPAFAPRLSLVLPTGDANKGFGNDRLGYEITAVQQDRERSLDTALQCRRLDLSRRPRPRPNELQPRCERDLCREQRF